MTPEKLPRAVVRARLYDSLKRRGPVRDAWRTAPVVVEWRAKPCNCWVLRVYLDPGGWHVTGRGFRVSLTEWAERQGQTRESFTAGEWGSFGKARKLDGFVDSQPLDFDAWTTGRFEIGCPHGRGLADMKKVLEDCQQFRARRARVDRAVSW